MQDAIGALRAHLANVTAVTDEVAATRMFVGTVPASFGNTMPVKAIMLRYAGGPVNFDTGRNRKPRVDIWCFGKVYQDADTVYRVVYETLHAVSGVLVSSTYIRSIGLAEGPLHITDEDTGWPAFVLQTQMNVDMRSAS